MTALLAGLAAALVLGLGLWIWRRSFRVPPAPPRIERINLRRRVRKAMLQELRRQEPIRKESGKAWTAKQMERELRRQLRADRQGRQNGDAA